MSQTLKIACHGFVEKTKGSVAGANFLVLEELLKRGFQIDFYGWRGFTEPKELFKYDNFRYISITDTSLTRAFINALPKSVGSLIQKTIYLALYIFILQRTDPLIVKQEIVKGHIENSYDVLLYLGTHCSYKIPNLPIVSWVQGPPRTEWFYIHKNRNKLIDIGAFDFYLKALIYYNLEDFLFMGSELRKSDILICGSQWSIQGFIEYGISSERVRALPYPIDTELFQQKQSETKQPREKKTFLWLGRIDTRKRFDLLLDAYNLLLQERQDVYLRVFGGFSHTSRYKKLLEKFEFPEYIEYTPSIERAKVPELLSQCDVLIQPSEGENFGSSVAEALCCGLPVIVGSTNGTKDYISSSSFIFSSYDAESLKKAMSKAVDAINREANYLASDARETSEKNFSISKVVSSLESILKEAISIYQRDK